MSEQKHPTHTWSTEKRGQYQLRIFYSNGENYTTTYKIVSPKKYMESVSDSKSGFRAVSAYWIKDGVTDLNPCWTINN